MIRDADKLEQLQSEAGWILWSYDRCPSEHAGEGKISPKGMGILPEKRGSFIS